MFFKISGKSIRVFFLLFLVVSLIPYKIKSADCGKGFKEYATLSGHKQGVIEAVFSPDGKYLSLSNKDFHVNIWDVATGKSLAMMNGFNEWPAQVTYSPEGKLLLTSDYEKIKIWEVPSGKPYKTIEKVEEPFALSPDGSYLVGKFKPSDGAYQLKLYSFPSGELKKVIDKAHEKMIRCIKWNPDSSLFASSSDDGTIKFWNGETGELIKTISAGNKVDIFEFCPKGKLISAIVGEDPGSFFTPAEVLVFEVTSGNLIKKLGGFNKGLQDLSFSPDGKYLVTGERGPKASLWRVSSWELAKTFDGHKYWVSHVSFSPDGKCLLTGSADEFVLWDVATGAKIQSSVAATQGLTSVVFSPDGKVIATTSTDNTVKLWKTEGE
ncbi:WD40 repeat domain-containing protein [candidate division WOR-3 bacterium]|nr:WD40 repeat domain-containing protein [candidate division WOR-3 bacterium]